MTAPELSDAELRTWAKENGIDGVPSSGKLSAAWREQISTAMLSSTDAAAVTDEDFFEEDEPVENVIAAFEAAEKHLTVSPEDDEFGAPWIPDPDERQAIRDDLEFALAKDFEILKERAREYRTPFIPDPNWVSGQTYTN